MKSASEILKIRQAKLEERLKENQDRINEEMLAVEKALNKYENDIDDKKPYISVDLILKTNEVKTLLKQMGYYIDKTNQDIPLNTTHIYLDKESYDIATKTRNFENTLNNISYTSKDKYKTKIYSDNNKQFKEDKILKDENKENIDLSGLLGRLILDEFLANKNKVRCEM